MVLNNRTGENALIVAHQVRQDMEKLIAELAGS